MNNNIEVHFSIPPIIKILKNIKRDEMPDFSIPLEVVFGPMDNPPDEIRVVDFLRYGGELKNVGEGFAVVFKNKSELGFCIDSVLKQRSQNSLTIAKGNVE